MMVYLFREELERRSFSVQKLAIYTFGENSLLCHYCEVFSEACCCWYLPVILSIYIFLQKLEMSLSSHIQVVRRQQQQAHLEIFSDVWGGSGGRWQLLEGGISCGFLIFHFFFSVCYYSQNLICCWDLRWEMASNSSKSDVSRWPHKMWIVYFIVSKMIPSNVQNY